MKVLISFIGDSSRYEESETIYYGKRIGKSKFNILNIIDHEKIDKVYILGMDTEETKDSMEEIKKEKDGIKTITTHNPFKEIFKIMNDEKKEYIIDITHGFRDFTYESIISALLLKELNYNIKLIYGIHNKKKKITEYKDLEEYFALFTLANEMVRAIKRLDFRVLEEKKEKAKERINIKRKNASEEERKKIMEEWSIFNEEINYGIEILFNLKMGNVHKTFMNYAKEWTNKETKDIPIYIKIMINEIKKEIKKIIEHIDDEKTSERQYKLGLLFIEKGELQKGITLIREAIVSHEIEKLGKDPYSKERTESDTNKNKEKPKEGKIIIIKGLRNGINHALSSITNYIQLSQILGRGLKENELIIKYNPEKYKKLIKKISEAYENYKNRN